MGQCWTTVAGRCSQCWNGVVYRCEMHCPCCGATPDRYTEFVPSSKGKYSDEKLLDQLHGRTEIDGDSTQFAGRTYAFREEEEEEEEDADMSESLDGHATSRGRQRISSVDPSEAVDMAVNSGAVEYHGRLVEASIVPGRSEKKEKEGDVHEALMKETERPPAGSPSLEEAGEATGMIDST